MLMPARELNTSPIRWCAVPIPAEPYVSLPGFALACAINSGTVFAGIDGFTTSTFGTIATTVIGAKSRWKSYGSFGYALVAIV
jgi:hypothetical protein